MLVTVLGVVDEFGNLFVFRVEETNGEDLLTEMLLQVNACQKDSNLDEHRLLWYALINFCFSIASFLC